MAHINPRSHLGCPEYYWLMRSIVLYSFHNICTSVFWVFYERFVGQETIWCAGTM
ncbi:predicted protein [Plenodomus lingam JN3]|uniref:Predicted protein n=1 Tax=Leptosphaeria maculans (strain JN3 / isolate v23.1.3 / race Av1-4-5-6-7-8) TaxID=985895 RepID=E5R4R7_LEPMJ|nr:predicted protein [Plenodomus lingam JN3]CBX92190.1 predicted protein [Plenodomus lingam JN3]